MIEPFAALSFYEYLALLAASVAGMFVHFEKKVRELRKENHQLTARRYFLDHRAAMASTVIQVVFGVGFMVANGSASITSAFLLGIAADSVTNLFSARAQKVQI